jgi:glycosidase
MSIPIFDSRDAAYRSPFGAVEAGTPVMLTLRVPRRLGITRAVIVTDYECFKQVRTWDMDWSGLDKGCDLYRATVDTLHCVGPLFYHFRLEWPDGIAAGTIGSPADGYGGAGELTAELPADYQITVFRPDTTPSWFGEGLTYHIFPDRFHRQRAAAPDGASGRPRTAASSLKHRFPDRKFHLRWTDTPDFLPNKAGEVTNTDFFGGTLAGVRCKLSYLQELGVETIYFSPVFLSASNHRYDTSDYFEIDPLFGTNDEFTEFCAAAKERGIRVILDGVFNHIGFDSRYFNGRGRFTEPGAYQSKDSPYYSWFEFTDWPDAYESWWGFYTLPHVRLEDKGYRRFINGEDGVVRHWLKTGASGWRLDVADELTDGFIAELRQACDAENPEAILIGEVWEDASHKEAYGVRRHYMAGGGLHGVMNYPFRNAALGYLLQGNAENFARAMSALQENYPPDAFYSSMTLLGTHDVPRALTVLGASDEAYTLSKAKRAEHRLPPEALKLAKARLKLGALLMYAFPGSPVLYYGDEAGLEGFEDPFNRRGYPWGREDEDLLAWYRKLGRLRKELAPLRKGSLRFLQAEADLLAYERVYGGKRAVAVTNRGNQPIAFRTPWDRARAVDALTGRTYRVTNGMLEIEVTELSGLLLL